MIRADGQLHSFLNFIGQVPAVDAAVAEIAGAMHQLWAGLPPETAG
jgi:hypothetical protein